MIPSLKTEATRLASTIDPSTELFWKIAFYFFQEILFEMRVTNASDWLDAYIRAKLFKYFYKDHCKSKK